MVARHAASVGVGMDESKLHAEVSKVVYFLETGKFNAEMRRKRIDQLRKETRKFKVGFFSQASISTEQIGELVKEGAISEEAGHTLKMMKFNLPLDTPRGSDQQMRLLQEKSRLMIEEMREKSKLAVKETREKSKLAIEEIKAKAKFAPPKQNGVVGDKRPPSGKEGEEEKGQEQPPNKRAKANEGKEKKKEASE
jgi:hypothetical protein